MKGAPIEPEPSAAKLVTPRGSLEPEGLPRTGAVSLEGIAMLKWALIFLVVALVAGALGFTGVARGAATISKVLFGIFLVIFVIMLLLAILAGEVLF